MSEESKFDWQETKASLESTKNSQYCELVEAKVSEALKRLDRAVSDILYADTSPLTPEQIQEYEEQQRRARRIHRRIIRAIKAQWERTKDAWLVFTGQIDPYDGY